MPDQQRSDQSMSDTSEQINLNPSIEGQQQNVEKLVPDFFQFGSHAVLNSAYVSVTELSLVQIDFILLF